MKSTGIVVVCIILMISAYLFYQAKTNPLNPPELFGIQVYTVISGSMQPTISPGDIILGSSKVKGVKEGDIITFVHDSEVITHRVTNIHTSAEGEVYKTKGDANETADNFELNESEVLSTHLLTIPYLGYMAGFASSTTGFVSLIIVPLLLLGLFELMNLFRKEDEKDKKTA
nr:signal peptidase I [Halobacillus sp. GSS1]